MRKTSSSDNNTLGGDRQRGGSESARRVLELLLSYSAERHTQTTKELAEATGIPLATTYRYVAFLRETGLLVERGDNGYSLSGRVIGLAQAAEAAESLIDVADPIMRRLSSEVGETVILVRLIAGAAVCVHRIESSHHLRISFEPGQPLPAQRGASGRVLLASLPPRELDRSLEELEPGEAERLREEIRLAGERGWATSSEEIDQGIWAASAAVVDPAGRTVASLSVPSPLVRAPAQAQERMLGRVRHAAARISAALREAAD